jgi:predicted MFS family arabinose efflux permease
VVEQAQLPSALGLSEGAFSAVGIVGASIAGALYAAGQLVPFLVNAASFLVSVVTLVFLRTEFQAERSEKPARLVAEIGEGLAWVWREPLIRFLAFVQAADNLRYGAGYLLIIVLAQRLGSTPVQIGLIFSGAAIGGLAGSVLSGWATRRFRVGRIAVFMLWIEALAFPFYSVAPSWTVLGAIALVESVLSPIYSVAIGTYRLSRTPDALRGRVGGAVSTVTTGTLSIGAIVGGILLSAIGPVALALACGGWLVLLALATTLNRQIRTATASGSSA